MDYIENVLNLIATHIIIYYTIRSTRPCRLARLCLKRCKNYKCKKYTQVLLYTIFVVPNTYIGDTHI